MKVLFCIRSDYLSKMAGDSVQLLTLVGYLKTLGIGVDINDGRMKDFSGYDVIHLFNLTRISETFHYFKTALKSGRPIVLTPVYWNLEKYYTYSGNVNYLRIWDMNQPLRREILRGCQMVYPSSKMERQLLLDEYGSDIPCTIVYNCLDTSKISSLQNAHSNMDFVLCAARICPRKNQLVVAEVCRELGIELLLAGYASNTEYLEKCLKLDNIRYLGLLGKSELIRLYQAARLHVLCSFVETPGLSSLEAGAYGCNILSTMEGCAQEYFEDMALYCNPYDEQDIYHAVRRALESNKQPLLQNHILRCFSMGTCLKPLYESYCSLTGEAGNQTVTLGS